MWSQPPSRTKRAKLETVCIASVNLGDARYTRTHAQDTAQHTRRHVRAEGGVVALRRGRGAASPPFCIFTQGAKMGRRKQSGTRDSRQCFYGRRSWTDGFRRCGTRVFKLNEYQVLKSVSSRQRSTLRGHGEIKPQYLYLIKRIDLTFCHRSLSDRSITLATSLGL